MILVRPTSPVAMAPRGGSGMSTRKNLYRLSDEMWAKIQPLLPKPVNTHRFGGGRPRADDRQCRVPCGHEADCQAPSGRGPVAAFGPEGAGDCSHGWSDAVVGIAEPVGNGSRYPPLRPGGATEVHQPATASRRVRAPHARGGNLSFRAQRSGVEESHRGCWRSRAARWVPAPTADAVLPAVVCHGPPRAGRDPTVRRVLAAASTRRVVRSSALPGGPLPGLSPGHAVGGPGLRPWRAR